MAHSIWKQVACSAALAAGMVLVVAAPVLGESLVGQGEWRSTQGGDYIRGTWAAELSRSGERVEGTMSLTGSNVLLSGTVDGEVRKGGEVVLGIAADGERAATFRGRLEGEQIAGEWEFEAVKDTGTWKGTLRSLASKP